MYLWEKGSLLLFIHHLVYKCLKGAKVTFIDKLKFRLAKLISLATQLFIGFILVKPLSDSTARCLFHHTKLPPR